MKTLPDNIRKMGIPATKIKKGTSLDPGAFNLLDAGTGFETVTFGL
jgi:hypothetical protein